MFQACPEHSRSVVKKIYTMNYTQRVNNNKNNNSLKYNFKLKILIPPQEQKQPWYPLFQKE